MECVLFSIGSQTCFLTRHSILKSGATVPVQHVEGSGGQCATVRIELHKHAQVAHAVNVSRKWRLITLTTMVCVRQGMVRPFLMSGGYGKCLEGTCC